ncbi:MAG: hypothetical protein HUU43_10740 [Ignavibacteriaceae bacterium]|nr:hypothetical protein [Ignavibacteriaceae bacterium]
MIDFESSQLKKMESKKKEFLESEEMKETAEQVIRDNHLDLRPSKIGYVLVYPYVSKSVPGKCVKTTPELKFYTTYDYMIQISGTIWDNLPEADRKILLLHLLLYVLPIMNEKTGEWDFKLRKPDIIAFSRVVDKHGKDWALGIKTLMTSIYNLSATQEEKVRI